MEISRDHFDFLDLFFKLLEEEIIIIFASVTEILKYFEKLLLFGYLVFSRTLCVTVYKFQASCFDELSFFFPRAGVLCLVKCDEGRFSSSVFTSWRRP